jgi:cysteinyl-tRNA synthetase
MLQFSGEKMSKSIGNLVTIHEFLEQHDSDILRMMILNSSYRNPLTYNEEVISQAEKALERLRSAVRPAQSKTDQSSPAAKQALEEQIQAAKTGFLEAMDDDFNTAGAMGHLFDLVRVINQAKADGIDDAGLKSAQDMLLELSATLGLRLEQTETESGEASALVDLLLEVRNELRSRKVWDMSDLIRDRLVDLNVVLEDSKEGTTWRWK